MPTIVFVLIIFALGTITGKLGKALLLGFVGYFLLATFAILLAMFAAVFLYTMFTL